ncbi:MAG: trypsin-like peptidase domain-containing protein [Labilithrix sp.]|nr:trypsin-like peptidase domain-containing protein [Labilithrix sp.]MCW5811989.1 trypsin-like peptidase domain-containing protein [Labilithrix sp.]
MQRRTVLVLSLVVPAFLTGCNRAKATENGTPGEETRAVTTVTSAAPAIANSTPPPLPSPRADEGIKTGPLSFAPVAKSADPSVVTIAASGTGPRGRVVRKGLGTGFIVQKDGVIVTNNHVVEEADAISVQLSDERVFEAKIVGRDPRTDIAVIRVDTEGKDLPAIALGDSDQLDVGDWVVAIGNPFGLSHTVSAGIVSGKSREREDVPLDPSGYYSFIQTDASINPGNSGGPLLNLRGEVIGMNTAVRGGGAQGIGFAIPINMIKTILPTLMKDGKITRSAIGIKIVDSRYLTPDQKTKLKLGDLKGVLVEDVEPGGPADKAKLQNGDLIVAFDGQPVDRSSLLQWKASTAGVGKTVTLKVTRDGQTLELPITLGELKEPRRAAPPPRPAVPDGLGDPLFRRE